MIPGVAQAARRPRPAQTRSWPAPRNGLVTNENLAQSAGNSARVLDNFFPTETGVRVRKGSAKHATLGGNPVKSMFGYVSSALSRKLFAADASNIYDITTVADPDIAVTAAVSSLTNGDWSDVQIGTTGGDFLVVCNGADEPRVYNGTTWNTLSGAGFTVTISGATTSDWSQGFLHQNRLFFMKAGSLDVYYLPIQSLGGAAGLLSLKSVFQRGGQLLFGESWSIDSGSGADDRAVFVTTEGEVAIYTGTDPASSSTWNLIGRYQIGKPLSKHAWIRAGGDLLIATEDGVVPLSAVVSKDPAALELSAVSRNIEDLWRAQYNARSSLSWSMLKWNAKAMGIISLPHTNLDASLGDPSGQPIALVVNLETGAWCRFTGWDIQAMAMIGDQAYFGDINGVVYAMESTGFDDTSGYVAKCGFYNDHSNSIGRFKTAHAMRGVFRASADFEPKFSIATDYNEDFPTAPDVAPATASTEALWDSGIWDESRWDDAASATLQNEVTSWETVTGNGIVFAPQVQISQGQTRALDIEMVSLDALYHVGSPFA